MIIEVPPFKVEVNKAYMTDFTKEGVEEGYVQAIKVVNNDCMRFLVHTEFNAIYSWLPIEAIFYDKQGGEFIRNKRTTTIHLLRSPCTILCNTLNRKCRCYGFIA